MAESVAFTKRTLSAVPEPEVGKRRIYICTDKRYLKLRVSRNGRGESGSYAGHSEGDDSEPGALFKDVQIETGWNERAQHRFWYRPVCEQDVLPGLSEDPCASR